MDPLPPTLMRTRALLLAVLTVLVSAVFTLRSGRTAVRAFSDIFTDVTGTAGISWKHFDGESEDRYLVQTMGGGVAFADFDNDGLLDIFLVTGGETPGHKASATPRNALYRNLGSGKFEEIAAQAGVDRIPFYGMGAAVADFDNDGFQDLLITGYPSVALFRNNGNNTFTDVTEKAGLNNRGRWAASAAWLDYDRDGRLDLFICNYAKFSFADRKTCEYQGTNTYCAQTAYEGEISALFHNNGDGTFTDVTERSGVGKFKGRALGVVSIDLNDDGWPDLFVARDASPNLLLINKHDGTFEDAALDAEVALAIDGSPRAGMGTDAGDLNGDGRPDLVVTNFNDENHSLYLNPGSFPFEEKTVESGLARFTRFYVGWGIRFLDYDNDGNQDLLVVNGHVNPMIEKARTNVSYKEPPLLLRNTGHGVLENMKDTAGPAFRTPYIARGLAIGDYNNDGAIDGIFTCLNDRPVLLRNNAGANNTWVGIQLQGTRSNRDAIGAKVTIRLNDRTLVRWITGGSSYLSSHDKRLVFGLNDWPASKPVNAEVRWPSNVREQFSGLQPNRYHRMVEGGGVLR